MTTSCYRNVTGLSLLFGLCLSLSGCFFLPDTTGTLWTNQAEIAAYIELYNAQQEEYRIEVEYKDSPANDLLETNEHPDMIICERIVSRTTFDQLTPLGPFFEKELIDPSIFYPNFLKVGQEEEDLFLLPVSFTIPAVLYKPSNIEVPLDNFFVSFQKMREIGDAFDTKKEERFTAIGFSPHWDINFMYLTTLLFGTDYRETSSGELAWNNQKLEESVAYIREWIGDTAEERRAVTEFTTKYMYDPDYKLINNDRVLFAYTTITDFLLIPQEKRTNLDFRWIARENRIQVMDDMLFFAIPKKGRRRKVVESFMVWFFNESTQRRLLETAQLTRMGGFGIAEGFSSITEVNERHFQRYYPELSGHIPTQQYLRFPKPLPIDWPHIKNDVLKPWLTETVRSPKYRDFGDSINAWMLQRPIH